MEPLHFLVREGPRELEGRQAGGVENLVGVGVADAAEEPWIREAPLQGVVLARQRFAKHLNRGLERLDAAAVERSYRIPTAHELHRSPFPGAGFGEQQGAVGHHEGGEQQPGPDARLLPRLSPTQPAGDHQVKHEKQIVSKSDENAFPGALNVLDRQARNRLDRRLNRSQNERTDKLQMLEPLAEMRVSAALRCTGRRRGAQATIPLIILAFRWRESCNP